MEVYRPSTCDSQQTFLPSQTQRVPSHDRRLSEATSAAQSQTTLQYSDEKSVVEPPLPAPWAKVAVPGNAYPLAAVHHYQHYPQTYWPSDGDLDPVPRYPGSPHVTDVSATLAVPPIEQTPRFEGTLCGVKKGLFLLLLALAGLVLLAIAIGVGVGVGLGHQKQIEPQPVFTEYGSSSTSSVHIATATTTTTTTTTTPTNPITSESPSLTTTSSVASLTTTSSTTLPIATGSCPGIQNTQYVTSNGKSFVQVCGLDYAGKDEANDIGSARTKTFTQCMEICAKKSDCTGAGWGPSEDDPEQHICWMKNKLQNHHKATPTWTFAILMAEKVDEEAQT